MSNKGLVDVCRDFVQFVKQESPGHMNMKKVTVRHYVSIQTHAVYSFLSNGSAVDPLARPFRAGGVQLSCW
jgi:hypothetical protein